MRRLRRIAGPSRALVDAFITLEGPLGAGKTTFARHLLRSLGATGRIKSPTYALLEPYDLPRLKASHFDFYRFNDPREWIDAGLRDVFAQPGLKLAEWPDKAGALLPVPDLSCTSHRKTMAGETSRCTPTRRAALSCWHEPTLPSRPPMAPRSCYNGRRGGAVVVGPKRASARASLRCVCGRQPTTRA